MFGFALLVRLLLLPLISHPGIADPNHYYNQALRLYSGQGFTIDYIWQYNRPPETIIHPEDHWMPLAAIIAVGSMTLFGTSVHAALLPFALLSALLVPIGFWAARQFKLEDLSCLFVGAWAALLPELVLASLRTDTTIVGAVLVCLSILLLTHGLQQGRISAFAGSGAAAGLAYLTRNDGLLLLPMMAVSLAAYMLWGRRERRLAFLWVLLMPLTFTLVIAPWIIRNVEVFGSATTPEADDMLFFTDHADHYAYGRQFTLETMLASQTPAQIISKRIFEAAAAVQVAYSAFDMFLPVAVCGGLLLVVTARDRQRLLTIAPALILILGIFVAYPLLIPYKSQAGSFKKAYLAAAPMLLPLAAYALERTILVQRFRQGAMILVTMLLVANAIQLVRTDARFTTNYYQSIQQVAEVAHSLPDTNDDGEIVLMTQDPFILSLAGFKSVMFPYEPRDVILEVARRYGVDYFLLPSARPVLDSLWAQQETDPGFELARAIPGTTYVFYRMAEGAE
jgi:hypothetical protein